MKKLLMKMNMKIPPLTKVSMMTVKKIIITKITKMMK